MKISVKYCHFSIFLLALLAFLLLIFYEKWENVWIYNTKIYYQLHKDIPKHTRTNISTEKTITKFSIMSLKTGFSTKPIVENKSSTYDSTVNCTLWKFPEIVEENKHPQIVLDPNKYIYPGIVYGPNNQIVGLKNTIYLAIYTNRTLVIPSFRAHWIHPGLLSPYQMIDVNKLCNFVSCISYQRLRKNCNYSFDVAFQLLWLNGHYLQMLNKAINGTMIKWCRDVLEDLKAGEIFKTSRPADFHSIAIIENDIGMNIIKPSKIYNVPFSGKFKITEKNVSASIPTLPNENVTKKYPGQFPSNPLFLKTVFNTNASCAIFAPIYKYIKTKADKYMAYPLKNETSSISDLPGNVLFSSITYAVQHPPCIVNAAQQYILDVLNSEMYVAVHWRYNKKDWIAGACKSWGKSICDDLTVIDTLYVAKVIVKYVENDILMLNKTMKKIPVYIASPPSLESFQTDVFNKFNRFSRIFEKPRETLRSFLSKNYQVCWEMNGWSNVEEIISLVEMEIAIHSYWFFYSPGSTWSENVRPYRTMKNDRNTLIKKFEKNIVSIVVNEVKIFSDI